MDRLCAGASRSIGRHMSVYCNTHLADPLRAQSLHTSVALGLTPARVRASFSKAGAISPCSRSNTHVAAVASSITCARLCANSCSLAPRRASPCSIGLALPIGRGLSTRSAALRPQPPSSRTWRNAAIFAGSSHGATCRGWQGARLQGPGAQRWHTSHADDAKKVEKTEEAGKSEKVEKAEKADMHWRKGSLGALLTATSALVARRLPSAEVPVIVSSDYLRLCSVSDPSGEAPPASDEHSGGWDLFTAVAVAGSVATHAIIAKWVFDEYRDFSHLENCEHTTFRAYSWYRFTDWFGGSKHAPVLVLAVFVQWLCIGSSFVYSMAGGTGGLGTGLLRSWGWIVSPDGGVGENAVSSRLVGAATSLGGIVIFALLVSMITETFAQEMTLLKDTQDAIIEGGHTVLIDWTDKSPMLANELALASESEGGACIAVLDPRPLEDVRLLIESDLDHVDLRGSRIVLRTGWFFHPKDLQKVAAKSAKSVIIQSDPSVSASESDGMAAQKLLALQNYGWPEDGRIIVHAAGSMSKDLFRSVSGEKACIVDTDVISARMMVQSTRYPGLSRVFEATFGFEGAEIYLEQWDALTGRAFKDAVFLFEDAIPIGVMTADGCCMLCPAAGYILKSSDRLIVYAEDNDTYQPASDCVVDFQGWLREHPMASMPAGAPQQQAERSLIIGWNTQIEALLCELGDCCAPGSSYTVLSQRPVAERKEQLQTFDRRMGTNCTGSLRVKHVVGSPTEQSDLANLSLASYDNIFVLPDPDADAKTAHWERPARIAADARTVTSLLLIRHILDASFAAARPRLVPELLESDMAGMMQIAGVCDFVDSNQVVSRLLAQVSEDPLVKTVTEELSSSKGCGIQIRSLAHYLPEGSTVPDSVTFWDVMCMVRRASEDICIGWRNPKRGDKGGEEEPWILNPPDRHASVAWGPEDLVVVVGKKTLEAAPTTRGTWRDTGALLLGRTCLVARNDLTAFSGKL